MENNNAARRRDARRFSYFVGKHRVFRFALTHCGEFAIHSKRLDFPTDWLYVGFAKSRKAAETRAADLVREDCRAPAAGDAR